MSNKGCITGEKKETLTVSDYESFQVISEHECQKIFNILTENLSELINVNIQDVLKIKG